MARKLIFVGILYLASVATAGVLDSRNGSEDKGKEPEKKPNIVKDYVCLRDGELCHPEFGRNRGLYVSCSNGVAWEQQCPKCTYHPITCPTRTLWFDGEKCEWASPKLASQPCIDHFPQVNHTHTEKDGTVSALSEQEALLQSLQYGSTPVKESMDKNKWQVNSNGPSFFKSPKSGADLNIEPVVEENAAEVEANHVSQEEEARNGAADNEDESSESVDSSIIKINKRKLLKSVQEESESEFPTYLHAEDDLIEGGKIIRLNDPVYTLVSNPDGSGKKVLMRISQPFVLEDPARAILPSVNIISSYSKE